MRKPDQKQTIDLKEVAPDQTSPPDKAGGDKPAADQPTTPPQVIITEIMPNEGGAIPEGEWFELYNAGSALDLAGWRLTDTMATHTISQSLVLGANQYLVLRSKAAKVAPSSYVYSDTSACAATANICLNNDGDTLQLFDAAGKLVDAVAFDQAWPYADGHSMSLKSPYLDNSKAANWCQETTAKYTQGNYGTPGAPAGCP